jgi:hypothetical protein
MRTGATSTSVWNPGLQAAIPTAATRARDAAQTQQDKPGFIQGLVDRAQSLWPILAGGIVVLAVIKFVYEKWIVDDASELRGVRIGWYNLLVVGVMAWVFRVGADVAAGGIAKAQQLAGKVV